MRGFAILCLCCVAAGSSVAQDSPTSIKSALEKAKATYDSDMEAFRKLVAEYFDKREETARNAGNKKLVDQVKEEREDFDKNGNLQPSVPMSLKRKAAFAISTMEAAYETATKGYTKAKKDDEASATEKELDRFKRTNARFVGMLDLVQKDTLWKGTFTVVKEKPAGKKHEIELHVLQRDGRIFKGKLRFGKDPNTIDFDGTVVSGRVEFKRRVIQKGVPDWFVEYSGSIQDDRVNFEFTTNINNGYAGKGYVELERKR